MGRPRAAPGQRRPETSPAGGGGEGDEDGDGGEGEEDNGDNGKAKLRLEASYNNCVDDQENDQDAAGELS